MIKKSSSDFSSHLLNNSKEFRYHIENVISSEDITHTKTRRWQFIIKLTSQFEMVNTIKTPWIWPTLFLLGALVTTSNAFALEVARIPFIDAPPGTPGLGPGVRFGQSPYVGSERNSDLIPLYLYEGKLLFAHGASFGLHLFRNDKLTFDLYSSYRFQQLDPDSNVYFQGMDKRKQTLDAGFSVDFYDFWGGVKLSWLTDTLNRHNGDEFELTYRYRIDRGRWLFTPWISLIKQDDDLTNYYFGVRPDEVRPDRPLYVPGNATNVAIGLNASYQLTRNWLLFANYGHIGFDTEIKNSPLVAEDNASTLFVGASYMFGNIFEPDLVQTERSGEWSWRVNYGYQADGSIVTDIAKGELRSSKDVDTEILGLTLSKLVQAGNRVDFYGRFAVFRHLEEPYQDNFWDYVAYVMAIGKGYMPWSEQQSFRWGFGFGFSYAQEVPMHEQIKQASKSGNTSQFLNYLEWMVDFPAYRIFQTKWARDCYVGLTIVHRSGIFATSDILGNVAGGSDWITGHWECLR